MKEIILLLILIINSSSILAQTVLTIEGQVVNSTVTGTWAGVNVSRNQPTIFTYRNNSITSVNSAGYMLQAGDESPLSTNNNLDGEVISGNKLIWNGTNGPSIITHGLFAGYNINSIIKYNYLQNVPYGIIFKSGTDAGQNMTFSSGGCAYNICKNGKFAGRVKGINGVKFYNNTFYSGDGGGWYLLLITENMDRVVPAPSTGTKVFNNIFYSTIQIPMIKLESGCLTNFESDYNVYWCSAGEPTFNIDGVTISWAQWKARGYDTHSVIINPDFINTTDFVPRVRLDYGKNLGTEWQTGLSTTATWVTGSSPTTTNQNGTWQAGARIYSSQRVPVTGITVTGSGGATTITTDNGTLQLSTSVLPDNATDKTLTWSIVNGTGQATVNSAGLVTAVDNGKVTAIATAKDGSGVSGSLVITISNQIVPVTGISVNGAGGSTTITTNGGSLQLSVTVLPENAANKTVTWSLVSGNGLASINSSGLVTALDNGIVTARAMANDGSGVSGNLVITISKQIIPVTAITVTATGGATTISTDKGSLQLTEAVLPLNATDKTVTWSVVNGTGQAIISGTGLVTAVNNGTVTARATADDGSGVSGILVLTISNQLVKVTGVIISGADGLSSIITDNGSLQLTSSVLPAEASDKSVTWSIVNGIGLVTINTTGLVTAVDNGTVTIRATANDNSGVYGTMVITILNQIVPVTGITLSSAGGMTSINIDDGSLQLYPDISPANASNKSVVWSLINNTGQADINTSGVITAINNGTVTAKATASDGSGVFGTLIITISNQIIPVTSLTINGAGGITFISENNGTLQLNETLLPLNATDKTVKWSIVNESGQADISATGLVTAVDNGTVTAIVAANDGSGISASMVITISNQVISVTSVIVTGAGDASIITAENGSIQLFAEVLPINATDNSVSWSIVNGTGQAEISPTGLVTASADGTVTATATANDGTGILGNLVLTISSSLIPVSAITVTGAGGTSVITTNKGSLQLYADVVPDNATDRTVSWSIISGTGLATIDATGLLSALADGNVTVRARSVDGSGVYGTRNITINNQVVPVTSITVRHDEGAAAITTDNGSLQLSVEVLPVNASVNLVTWSIVNGTDLATINSSGLVTAADNGSATVRAEANDGSGIFGTLVITISNQIVPVTSITITSESGLSTISIDDGSLQLSAEVLPANASDKAVIWSLVNGTGEATINSNGLVTAVDNGTVTVTATATDATGVYGTLVIDISNQLVPVTGIIISGAGGTTSIAADNGTLQLTASVLPLNASNKTLAWSLANGSGLATINASGLVSSIDNGTVTVRATAADGSGVYGTMVITISNQILPVTNIDITGSGGSSVITADNGSLQLSAAILPMNATNKSLTWSLTNGTGLATINASGRVTAIDNGTVTARAAANDGSGVSGILLITISNQSVPVTGITLTGAGGLTSITTDNGTLQLSAAVIPLNATNKNVAWSLASGSGLASVDVTGRVTAIDNGIITVRATATDGSGVSGSLVLTISNQIVPVANLIISGSGGASIITSDNGSLQMIASVFPINATNKTVTWSIVNGTGQATIDPTGLVTAVDNGTVTVRASANDGSNQNDNLLITIFNQIIPVTGITVAGMGGSSSITGNNGSLQLSASVSPANATDKTVTWSIAGGTGRATISADGIVTALDNGIINVRATANDGSGIYGMLVVDISNQAGPVTSITVTSSGNVTTISKDDGSLQLSADVFPVNATVKTVTWSFVNSTTLAAINSSGLLTAIDNGFVIVRATARDGSGVYGTIIITISNQIVPVSGINVTGAGGVSAIFADKGSLQLSAEVLPSNVIDKTVTWSIPGGTGQAAINSAGLVTAIQDGIVTAQATANDGSGVFGTMDIAISGQMVRTTSITLTTTEGITSITTDDGSLQINASVLPSGAMDKTVTWSILNSSGQATISANGLITAIDNGTVIALATANDGSGIYGKLEISISNQLVHVSGISITGEGGANSVASDNGLLQLIAEVLPANATNKSVTWSISNGTGFASISSTGLVTGIENGTVTARASSNDGSDVYGTIVLIITGQIVPVTGITITVEDDESIINDNYGKLQLRAAVFPANATEKSVTWSLVNGTGLATINSSGLVTAVDKGSITAMATANDGSGIYAMIDIPIIIDNYELNSIIVSSDEIRIQLNQNYLSWKAELYNFSGRLLISKFVESELLVIDISSLPSGMYLVVLSKGSALRVAKVIIP